MHKTPIRDRIKLPLVVPSFTSKGFYKGYLQYSFENLKDYLYGSVLVSTYDLFHDNLILNDADWGKADLVFLDSGGYELAAGWDTTEPKKLYYVPQSFVRSNYINILADLPSEKHFIITNFDFATQYEALDIQINKAIDIFNKFPKFYHNFIIKPGLSDNGVISINDVAEKVELMKSFDIIGVTEVEIGKTLKERLENIRKLRQLLDRMQINAPIHIWGGLDPVLTPLYLFAGAEIFDGVSWLRYYYTKGCAVNLVSYPVLTGVGLESRIGDELGLMAAVANLSYLEALESSFKNYNRSTPNFEIFEQCTEFKDIMTQVFERGE